MQPICEKIKDTIKKHSKIYLAILFILGVILSGNY